jgi:hypothetical protein
MTLATSFGFAGKSISQVSTFDSQEELCLFFAAPYAQALGYRLADIEKNEALRRVIVQTEAYYTNFDAMDLGATLRAVDDTFALDIEALLNGFSGSEDLLKEWWVVKNVTFCLDSFRQQN